MHIYLVGGAVRDSLLNIDVSDRDWVVTGSTPEHMLNQGFITVGKDFPVFLHPETKEEYALARTEKKSGFGYTGFDCFFSPDVSLEEDLQRRDLTINAIAQDEQGNLIDPYHGRQDIQSRVLRHVSKAFTEDPLRVLRVARFAAKLAYLDFTIAPETMALMQKMVQSGELAHLTPERVWQEFNKALASSAPQKFISVLRECGALSVIFPEIDHLFKVTLAEGWYQNMDAGTHALVAARKAAEVSPSLPVRFAAMILNIGKRKTGENKPISGKKNIQSLCQRIRVPSGYRDLALLSCNCYNDIHRIESLSAEMILQLLNRIDVWRKPELLTDVLSCCQADYLASEQSASDDAQDSYPQKRLAEIAYQAALKINVQEIVQAGFQGKMIREELNRQRVNAIQQVIPEQ